MKPRRVVIGGEGRHELGCWADLPQYRDAKVKGVVEALLGKINDNFEIVDGIVWKGISKFRAGEHRKHEERNVSGLALRAKELGAECVAFVRDRDGKRNAPRQDAIFRGVEQARKEFPDVAVVGEVCVEKLEAWLLALQGDRRTEEKTDPKRRLASEFGINNRANMVALVKDADLLNVPDDAHSLHDWIDRARDAFARVGDRR